MTHDNPKPAPRQLDPAYLAAVRELPCCVCGRRGVDPHHTGKSGVGMKSSDRDTIPLDRLCHRNLHDLRGFFKGWDKDRRREWESAMIEATRAKLEEIA